jgi:copper(I)-binding protein
MKKIILLFLSCISLIAIAKTAKPTERTPQIQVINPWVRLLPGKMSTGAFMEIKNLTDKDLYLIKALSPIAKTVELHDHVKVDGMMKMQAVERILIPAKSSALLKKGSLHIMIIDLTTELKKDSVVDLELQISDGSSLHINAKVLTDL